MIWHWLIRGRDGELGSVKLTADRIRAIDAQVLTEAYGPPVWTRVYRKDDQAIQERERKFGVVADTETRPVARKERLAVMRRSGG